MKLKPNAILFDMDGVLVNSLDSWWISLNDALKTFNYEEVNKNEFIKKYWGNDFYDNIKTMGLNQEVGIFCKNNYGKHVDLVKIYPETEDTLQKLIKYRKGIITNTPKECTYKILNKFNIEHYFNTVVTTDDVIRGKPDPEIILRACNIMKVDPKTTILVGDTENDMKAGRAAGCIIIGINIEADFKIQNLSELTNIITY
jgi:HAD superfamily hydrolase (TIGR01509 family)